jgi:gluconate 2-dehydrogenase gamma chain
MGFRMKGNRLPMSRRDMLAGAALGVVWSLTPAEARTITGEFPWEPDSANPPEPVQPGPWQFFTAEEARSIEAIVDRLIPPDDETPGGKEAGCAVFIDRQLAGPYGSARALYMRPPFMDGTPQQGLQSPLTPAMRYRHGLAALDSHCRKNFGDKSFADLADVHKDEVLTGMQKGPITFDGVSAVGFFEQVLTNTREGFFADPIYGGNRDMVGWKMIGFPGARYDYRDWIDRHNERYPLPPLSIGGKRA